MKKYIKLYSILMVIFVFSMLMACKKDNIVTEKTIGDVEPNQINFMYSDSDPIKCDNLSIKINKIRCYEATNYNLIVDLTITNEDYITTKYNIKNVDVTKQSTVVKYTVNYKSELTLEAELVGKLRFESTIPTSIEEENYSLYFEINSHKIALYLYEMPDEIRETRKVNYFINDELVKTDVVKYKRKIDSFYIYDYIDNESYCSTWYTYSDEDIRNEFDKDTLITDDINLYGIKESNFNWLDYRPNDDSNINAINYVPRSGILVVPDSYLGADVRIIIHEIDEPTLKEIYIPKSVLSIYINNITNKDMIIYYEGTEEEWENSLNLSSGEITNQIIFNTKYSK